MNIKIIIILSIIIGVSVEKIEIEDEFQYCHIAIDQKPIDTSDLCAQKLHKQITLNSNFEIKTIYQYAILSRNDNNINGIGFECEVFYHRRSYHETWFFDRSHRDESIKIVILNKEECEHMVYNKKCGEEDMTCDNDGCKYMKEPKENDSYYFYFSTSDPIITFRTCRITYKPIIAHSIENMIFSHNCFVKDYVCVLEHSIIIWDKSIINDCPFTLIMNISLQLDNNIFVDKADKFSFEYLESEKICGFNSIKTTEGLNLININILDSISVKLVKNIENNKEIDFQIFNRFNLVERDYFRYVNYNNEKEIKTYECELYIENINFQLKFNNVFFKKHDLNLYENIFYVKNHQLYIPMCIRVKKIFIESTFKKINNTCEMYPKVKFEYMGNILDAYYNFNGILSSNSQKVNCPNEMIFIPLPTINSFLLQRGSKFSIISKDKANLVVLNINNFKMNEPVNLQHSNIFNKKLVSGIFGLTDQTNLNENSIKSHPLKHLYVKSIVDNAYNFTKTTILKLAILWTNITLIVVMVILSLIVYVLFNYKKIIFNCLNKKNNTNVQIINANEQNSNANELTFETNNLNANVPLLTDNDQLATTNANSSKIPPPPPPMNCFINY